MEIVMTEHETMKKDENPVKNDSKPQKKGCLLGCLAAVIVAVLLVVGLFVLGYLNRHKILPLIMEKTDIEVVTVMQHMGTEVESGLPSEFLDDAYQIDLPRREGTVKVASVEGSVDQTYGRLLEYYEGEGWEVDEEVEVLKDAPEHVESFSKHAGEWKAAELAKDDKKMGVAVTTYRDETLGIVWHSPAEEAETAVPEPEDRDLREQEADDAEPEEVSGSDPEDIPVYPDSVRTSYRELKEGDGRIQKVAYAARADENEVKDFLKNEMEKENWAIEREARKGEERYLELSKGEKEVQIVIKKSDDYAGYTEIMVMVIE